MYCRSLSWSLVVGWSLMLPGKNHYRSTAKINFKALWPIIS